MKARRHGARGRGPGAILALRRRHSTCCRRTRIRSSGRPAALIRKVNAQVGMDAGCSAHGCWWKTGTPSSGVPWAGSGAEARRAGTSPANHKTFIARSLSGAGSEQLEAGPCSGTGRSPTAPTGSVGARATGAKCSGGRIDSGHSLGAFDRHRQDDRGGGVGALDQLDAVDLLRPPGMHGQVADCWPPEVEGELRAGNVHDADVVGEVDAVLQGVVLVVPSS